MVSLWPWKSEDNSPASFEKTLSSLATKISKSQLQLDSLRQRGRRVKALWTLYTSFTYLLCFIILVLVVGWRNWSAWEYTAVSGGPLLIHVIRTGLTAYYNFRVESVSHRLEEHQAERAKTIDKLKAATKYNSTQELLEKYGGVPPKTTPKPKKEGSTVKTPRSQKQPQRTGMGPPATANIPRANQTPSQPSTPQPLARTPPPHNYPPPAAPVAQAGPAEFAPNAFSAPPQYANYVDSSGEGRWYDRVLDLLLGEDETLPKNRMVLICRHCRLVNGQAPPGTNRLQDLGRWRCFGCGGWNGDEDEGLKAVQEMKVKIENDIPGQGIAPSDERVADVETPSGNDGLENDNEEVILVDGKEVELSDEVQIKTKKGSTKHARKKT